MKRGIAALCVALSWACDRSEPPATTPPTSDAPPATTDTAEPEKACRDWSSLDPSTLPPLPDTPYSATLDAAWRTVLAKHYDPTLGCKDWPALRVQYGKELAKAKDEATAYRVMNAMLGELGQSHLALVPPSADIRGEPREGTTAGPALVPIAVRYLAEKVVIVDDSAHGMKSGLPRGASIISVDDTPVSSAIDVAKKNFDRDVEVAFHVARTVESWLMCPRGAKKKVTYQLEGADKPVDKKVACKEPKVEVVTMGHLQMPVSVEHRMLPKSKVGYVTFNVWLMPVVPKLEAAIASLRKKGMQSLVIDLRGNPGGVGVMVVPVARMLMTEAASLGEMKMREGNQIFKIIEAPQDAFTGPIAILVDEGTGSTSEIFAQALQDLGRVKVYGAGPSQGAALPSLIEELPGGAKLQYVVADYTSPKGISVEGKGVAPDTVVPESPADYAGGRDPVLDAAAAALQTPATG